MCSRRYCLQSVDPLPNLSTAVNLVTGTPCLAARERLSEE
jgi:hypothetical protein